MNLSIVIASYGDNHWKHLGDTRALRSAHAQGAEEIVRIHQQDGTVAACRNAGAEKASGDWLLFLDADDELAPGFVGAMRQVFEQEDRNGTHFLLTPAVSYRRGRGGSPARLWPEVDLRDGNWLVIGTCVQRQLFLDVGGFREGVHLYEDWCLWQRCWKAGADVIPVPEAVYVAHINPKSRNRQPGRNEKLRWHEEIRRHNFPELYAS